MSESAEYMKCPCDHCGEELEFPADGVGTEIECPTCHQKTMLHPPAARTTVPPTSSSPIPYMRCPCLHCGKQIGFSESAIGDIIQCPQCGQQTMLHRPVAGETTPPQKEPPRKRAEDGKTTGIRLTRTCAIAAITITTDACKSSEIIAVTIKAVAGPRHSLRCKRIRLSRRNIGRRRRRLIWILGALAPVAGARQRVAAAEAANGEGEGSLGTLASGTVLIAPHSGHWACRPTVPSSVRNNLLHSSQRNSIDIGHLPNWTIENIAKNGGRGNGSQMARKNPNDE